MVDFISGTCVGLINVLIGQPLDTVKVCIQTETAINWRSIRFLYRGATVPFVVMPFENAMVFGTYHKTKEYLICEKIVKNSVSIDFVSGITAGFIYGQFAAPLEYLKIRSQTYYRKSKSVLHTSHTTPFQQLLQLSDITTLFTGYKITVFRDMCAFGAQFTTYQYCKEYMINRYGYKHKNEIYAFCGAIGGIACWVASYPQDVIKSNMQQYNRKNGGINTETTFHVTKNIYNKFGIAGFYRGITACLIRVAATDAVGFWVFETVKSILNRSVESYHDSSTSNI